MPICGGKLLGTGSPGMLRRQDSGSINVCTRAGREQLIRLAFPSFFGDRSDDATPPYNITVHRDVLGREEMEKSCETR
jgi:hypothetical protein